MFDTNQTPPTMMNARAALEKREAANGMMNMMLEGLLDLMLEREDDPVKKAAMTVLKKHMRLDKAMKRMVKIASPELKGEPEKLLEAESAAIKVLDEIEKLIDGYLTAYPPENYLPEEETNNKNPLASLFD